MNAMVRCVQITEPQHIFELGNNPTRAAVWKEIWQHAEGYGGWEMSLEVEEIAARGAE